MTGSSRTRLRRHTGARAGAVLAMMVATVAVLGPFLAQDPNIPNYAHQLAAPSQQHWLGTDLAGRDVFARTVAGARASLEAVLVVFSLTTVLGLLIGGLSGYLRGAVDAVLSRAIDVLLSVPSLIVALAIVGALGVGPTHLVLALVASGWAYPARITRSLVLSSHTRPDVLAARMAGVGRARILRTHVLPGTLAAVLVAATTTVGDVVLALAGLSFLGLGAQPPTAELGQMLAESQSSLGTAPWLLLGPGVFVVLTVAAAMLFSDALRDVADPAAPRLRQHPRAGRQADASPPTTDGWPLQITDLTVTYPGGVCAVRGVSLAIAQDECLALVGESGCGKTTLARATLGLLPGGASTSGDLRVAATDVLDLPNHAMRRIRGRVIGYVAQDPYAACDPLRTVRHHVDEASRIHGVRPNEGDSARRVAKLGVSPARDRLAERPHRWSGGMLQRATIAAANVHCPLLMVADEPSSALDAELADDVLTSLRAASPALLLVSHDLRLVARHSDRVAVMYAGRIVETGPTAQVVSRPRHPYTRALLAATPQGDGSVPVALPGTPPSLAGEQTTACPFAARCSDAHDICHQREPDLVEGLACWNVTSIAALP